MGKHKKECRKNYLTRCRKMLKERKVQDEDPTSHIPEEESTSSPAGSVVDEPNPTSHLQEEETTSSPAESVVDEPNPKKRRGNDSHATFCANAQYRTFGELPPELQFNLMKAIAYFSFTELASLSKKSSCVLTVLYWTRAWCVASKGDVTSELCNKNGFLLRTAHRQQHSKIWKTEFLPNIKKEIRNELKTEIEKINCLITNLSKHLDSIESSQQLISDKHASVLKSMQSTKKQINDLNNWCEAQDNKINHLNGSVYDAEAAIDSIQQYSRRDCLEISGIPILPLDSPANLTLEMGQLIGVTIDKQDISIAHRLPDTKGKKERFIVKFVHREKQDEFYKSHKHLGGKKASMLPSMACEMGKSIYKDSAMYINESLTQYCSDLFGRVKKFNE